MKFLLKSRIEKNIVRITGKRNKCLESKNSLFKEIEKLEHKIELIEESPGNSEDEQSKFQEAVSSSQSKELEYYNETIGKCKTFLKEIDLTEQLLSSRLNVLQNRLDIRNTTERASVIRKDLKEDLCVLKKVDVDLKKLEEDSENFGEFNDLTEEEVALL